MVWSELAWKRHLALAGQSTFYGGHGSWYYYDVPGGVVFLNQETGAERTVTPTDGEKLSLFYGGASIERLPFVADIIKPNRELASCHR